MLQVRISVYEADEALEFADRYAESWILRISMAFGRVRRLPFTWKTISRINDLPKVMASWQPYIAYPRFTMALIILLRTILQPDQFFLTSDSFWLCNARPTTRTPKWEPLPHDRSGLLAPYRLQLKRPETLINIRHVSDSDDRDGSCGHFFFSNAVDVCCNTDRYTWAEVKH